MIEETKGDVKKRVWGMGPVQNVIDLKDQLSLKVLPANWWSPNYEVESIIDTKMKGDVYGLIDQNKEKINSMHIFLDIIPVGVKFLREEEMPTDFSVVQNPKVRSYCDVIRLLRKEEFCQGNVFTLDSNTVCKWNPANLGLKKPDNELEKKLSPIMEESFDGVFVFNINTPKEKHPLSSAIENPDTVIIVGTREILADVI